MSTTTFTFSFTSGTALTDPDSIVLQDSTNSWGAIRIDTGATVVAVGTAMSRLSAGVYQYAFSDPAPSLSYKWSVKYSYQGFTGFAVFTSNFGGVTMALGSIITQASVAAWMGALNLGILTTQDPSSITINPIVLQAAINSAESRVYSVLGQLRCSVGTFFQIPLTVGGLPILSVPASISLGIIQTAAHQYCGFLLNKWRQLLSSTDDDGQSPTIFVTAKAWEKDADANLRAINRWAMGFYDGQYVDLDLGATSVIGAPYRSMEMPSYGIARVGPDGRPFRRIGNALDWWMYPPDIGNWVGMPLME